MPNSSDRERSSRRTKYSSSLFHFYDDDVTTTRPTWPHDGGERPRHQHPVVNMNGSQDAWHPVGSPNEIDHPRWTKHVISYDEGIGTGMGVPVVDLDGDADLDVVVTGKWGGLVWSENRTRP